MAIRSVSKFFGNPGKAGVNRIFPLFETYTSFTPLGSEAYDCCGIVMTPLSRARLTQERTKSRDRFQGSSDDRTGQQGGTVRHDYYSQMAAQRFECTYQRGLSDCVEDHVGLIQASTRGLFVRARTMFDLVERSTSAVVTDAPAEHRFVPIRKQIDRWRPLRSYSPVRSWRMLTVFSPEKRDFAAQDVAAGLKQRSICFRMGTKRCSAGHR